MSSLQNDDSNVSKHVLCTDLAKAECKLAKAVGSIKLLRSITHFKEELDLLCAFATCSQNFLRACVI